MISSIKSVSPAGFPKRNNLFFQERNNLHQIRRLLYLQAIFGINRLYLLVNNKLIRWIFYFISGFIIFIAVSSILTETLARASYIVVKDALVVEYILLSINALFLVRSTAKKFIKNLNSFDESLNIYANNKLSNVTVAHTFLITLAVFYMVTEGLFFYAYYETGILMDTKYILLLITTIAQDVEIILVCTMIIFVLRRVKVLKGHVIKLFVMQNEIIIEKNTFEELSFKTNLDISSVHKAYEQLHKCSTQLNRMISFPMMLTRDSEISYALWGVIRMDMSLPLSYMSLCTTYLIIVVQFSKFID
ncbi:unnamed protein product [Leptidea sinapis]|uniref:Gustatory receptor n=1 Tax=Leptidea sinapis TaxID=189913 RepID=A0A5E4R9Z1_9NEOP|nr:unnamed protein product [Leptidea sinapis]